MAFPARPDLAAADNAGSAVGESRGFPKLSSGSRRDGIFRAAGPLSMGRQPTWGTGLPLEGAGESLLSKANGQTRFL